MNWKTRAILGVMRDGIIAETPDLYPGHSAEVNTAAIEAIADLGVETWSKVFEVVPAGMIDMVYEDLVIKGLSMADFNAKMARVKEAMRFEASMGNIPMDVVERGRAFEAEALEGTGFTHEDLDRMEADRLNGDRPRLPDALKKKANEVAERAATAARVREIM